MGPFGVVFPGQGSQYPGMGQDLYRRNQSVRELFATAGEVLGRDMAALCFEGPQEALDLTANTQIAVLMADLAAWIAFSERVTKAPAVLAGHSLGEYAALFAAGAVGLRDVLSLVDLRGKYHQEAVPVGEGAMAAILGLPRAAVEELCRGIDREKNVVNLSIENAPGQIVVSGHAAAIDQVIAAAETKEGGRGVKLPISVPCHSPLLSQRRTGLPRRSRRSTSASAGFPLFPTAARASFIPGKSRGSCWPDRSPLPSGGRRRSRGSPRWASTPSWSSARSGPSRD